MQDEATVTPAEDLPRLLVVSDPNAERTGGGALVLYRLLRTYPADRLMIVSQPTANWSGPRDRIPGVTYHDITYRIPHLIFNRFNPCWAAVMAPFIKLRTPEVLRLSRAFRPQAVLSIADQYLWFVADTVARWLKIPSHLIIHDDWPVQQTGSAPPWARPYALRACVLTQERVFRRAAGLYAVSPGMAEQYEKECGVRCDVVYPSRGEDSPVPKVRLQRGPADRLTVAYAGMIHQHWAKLALAAVAKQLAEMGGQLDLYVPYSAERLSEWGISGPNVRHVGFFPAHEMAEQVGRTAHALLLPASFEPEERRDASTLFPSKLADYTGIGLPVVVWGPEYSSAARWARENPEAAVLVMTPEAKGLAAPLTRLRDDPAHARKLAEGAISAGLRYFDPSSVRSKFFSALRERSGFKSLPLTQQGSSSSTAEDGERGAT